LRYPAVGGLDDPPNPIGACLRWDNVDPTYGSVHRVVQQRT